MSKITHTLPWAESPFFERELRESDLNEADKKFVKEFADNGYVIIDPQIDETTIERLKKAMEPNFNPSDPNQKPTTRIQDAWRYNEDVKKLLFPQRS